MIAENKVEMEPVRVATDVLVIGGGLGAARAAAQIQAAGYPVTWIHHGKAVEPGTELSGSAVKVQFETSVCGACGVAGDYSVFLKDAKGNVANHTFGAVVVATGLQARPLNDRYGLALSDCVVSLGQLEQTLASNGKALSGKTIAFLVGLAQNGNPVLMERVLKDVSAAQSIEGVSVYVYAGDLKVASEGLERLYKEGRDKGAIYIKLAEPPTVSDNGAKISHRDPVVRETIELAPDMVVVEESLTVDPVTQDLAAFFRIDTGPEGFLQRDNVHFFPVRCNREGIFVVGGARDVQNLSWTGIDAENAALEIKSLLGNGVKAVAVEKAVVNPARCTICLTCYRCCPHGAIYWEGDKAVVSPVACQGCGICASECPMDAIQVGGYQDDTMLDAVKTAAGAKEKPAIVAFCCQNSGFEAAQMAESFGMALPAGLRTVKVPCAGKVDLDYIMNAFAEGADGVLVMACHTGNCQSDRGNTYAGWRVEDAQRMLEEAGFEKERLRFATLASNMGPEFSNIVVDMAEKIKALK